jgi:hypothetical protein
VRLRSKAPRKKIAPAAEIDFGQPISDRGPGLRRDLELDRPPGLLLDHGPAVPHPATGAHVLDLYRDEIAATQLAVNREVEQGEVALPTLKLKPDLDCPHLLRLERVLLADQATLVPGRPRKAHNGRDRSVHGRLLGPDRPLSQRTPATAASQPSRAAAFRSLSGRLRSPRRCGETPRLQTFPASLRNEEVRPKAGLRRRRQEVLAVAPLRSFIAKAAATMTRHLLDAYFGRKDRTPASRLFHLLPPITGRAVSSIGATPSFERPRAKRVDRQVDPLFYRPMSKPIATPGRSPKNPVAQRVLGATGNAEVEMRRALALVPAATSRATAGRRAVLPGAGTHGARTTGLVLSAATKTRRSLEVPPALSSDPQPETRVSGFPVGFRIVIGRQRHRGSAGGPRGAGSLAVRAASPATDHPVAGLLHTCSHHR